MERDGMTLAMATDDYYAREADRIARGPQLYGGNAAIVDLRCFKFYHPDQGSWMTAPDGRQRWLGPKTSRIYAILHRDHATTMIAVAKEAGCVPSTVSRAITRLQAWGFMAVDVKRGRNGGIVVTMAKVARQFKAHIDAAWRRIRSWINVASRSPLNVEGTTTEKDATFSGVPHTFTSLGAEAEWARAERWAAQVIEERRRLDWDEPDWDLEADKIRASVGWG